LKKDGTEWIVHQQQAEKDHGQGGEGVPGQLFVEDLPAPRDAEYRYDILIRARIAKQIRRDVVGEMDGKLCTDQ